MKHLRLLIITLLLPLTSLQAISENLFLSLPPAALFSIATFNGYKWHKTDKELKKYIAKKKLLEKEPGNKEKLSREKLLELAQNKYPEPRDGEPKYIQLAKVNYIISTLEPKRNQYRRTTKICLFIGSLVAAFFMFIKSSLTKQKKRFERMLQKQKDRFAAEIEKEEEDFADKMQAIRNHSIRQLADLREIFKTNYPELTSAELHEIVPTDFVDSWLNDEGRGTEQEIFRRLSIVLIRKGDRQTTIIPPGELV